jgi:SAM-dependent methyltransferase
MYMTMTQFDMERFSVGEIENPVYWARFGGKPDFSDAVVADLGCGRGSLCIDIATSGARRVIGFDVDAPRLGFAQENLECNYPHLKSVVEFRLQDVRQTPEIDDIDYFVSKDTFEHVIDLDQVLDAMKRRLKPGGKLYIGFAPLWNSPFGDHGRTKTLIPWGHVFLEERYLIRRLNRHQSGQISSIYDLGLNKLALVDYLRIFQECGMEILFLRVNDDRLMSKAFTLLGSLPLLKEYFSHSLYCVLQKPS